MPDRSEHSAPRGSVGFVSLGCAKNTADSQVLAGVLIRAGYTLAPSTDRADAVVVNTCAFIRAAREESLNEIREVCRAKTEGRCRAVVVAGCLPQMRGEALAAELPDVDAFIGIDRLDEIADVIGRALSGRRGEAAISSDARRLFDPPVPGLVFSRGVYAYVKIAEGCGHGCTFCTIPSIRGRYRSRPVESVTREAEAALEQGFREVVLVSQDSTAYGADLAQPATLPSLLRAMDAIGGEFWIRVLYGFPNGVTDALLETLATLPKVCRYLDVPIQHGDPEVLRRMGRAVTADAVRDLPRRARAAMPDIALRTTCLVGFPGETEENFGRLLEYVRAARFDHLGVFVYSPEPGTPGAAMGDRVPAAVAEERRMRLLEAQRQVVDEKAAASRGVEDVVLVEGREPRGHGAWVARSARQAPEVDGVTFVRGPLAAEHIGEFVRVRYTRPRGYDMEARTV